MIKFKKVSHYKPKVDIIGFLFYHLKKVKNL